MPTYRRFSIELWCRQGIPRLIGSGPEDCYSHKAFNCRAQLGEISISFLEIVERKTPVVGCQMEVVRIISYNSEVLDNFRPGIGSILNICSTLDTTHTWSPTSENAPQPISLHKTARRIDALCSPNLNSGGIQASDRVKHDSGNPPVTVESDLGDHGETSPHLLAEEGPVLG